MFATLGYLSFLQDYDFISIFNGGKPMRNNNDCLSSLLDKFIKSFLNLMFAFGIKSYKYRMKSILPEVASSRSSTLGFLTKARAIAIRCF